MIDNSFASLGASLLVGALIGVERGFRTRERLAGTRVAGLRTFMLLGLGGGCAGLLLRTGMELASVAFLVLAYIPILVGYRRQSAESTGASATHALAALMTLFLGTLAASGFPGEALASACIATIILASRRQLHGWLGSLNEIDLQAMLRFALIATAAWPFLPSGDFGPFDALNPRELWGVVVLVSGFSLAGYLANKRFGSSRGTLATAALGGLYSSTAVIAALAGRLRAESEAARAIMAGIAVASAVMFGRVLILCALLAPTAWPTLAVATGPAAALALGWAIWATRRVDTVLCKDDGPAPASTRNPVELLPALGFALLVGAAAIVTGWAQSRFGGAGAGLVIMITGSFDVDAAIVTLGGLRPDVFAPREAGLILAVPVLANTLFKAAIVLVTGGSARWTAAAPLFASAGVIAGATALLALG
jgi:uncharacterized membrane protein (DUF4010 family)